MVAAIAANYRGQKGIDFEELEATGRLGLVKAARKWEGRGDFAGFAAHGIDFEIFNFVRDYKHLTLVGDPRDDDNEKHFWEWQQFFAAPYECWKSLAASPDELLATFDDMRASRLALSSAMLGLSKRERQMIMAAYLRDPGQSLRSIAREHKISYATTVRVIKRALFKLRNVIQAIESKRETIAAAG